MSFLEVNPRYQPLLEQGGLRSVEDFLALPALIVSGHPDRHVGEVSLGQDKLHAYLKREHRVRWKDRVANAWAGYGLVSRSLREAATLRAAASAGIGCPEWLASGEDDRGRAFLLVRRAAGTVELLQQLQLLEGAPRPTRRQLGKTLGRALARLHGAGFHHSDLYAKHVLIDAARGAPVLLDWQRATRRAAVSHAQRLRDLGALHATVPANAVTVRERLGCLRAYCRTARLPCSLNLARSIESEARRLLRKRHVREGSVSLLKPRAQGLLWLDGESVCVTHEFWEELAGDVPTWLCPPAGEGDGCWEQVLILPDGRRARMVRRSVWQPLAWLGCLLRQRPLVSPEVREAGRLLRAHRLGGAGPRLLAFGQRHVPCCRTESFLLTEQKGPACALQATAGPSSRSVAAPLRAGRGA